MPKAFIDLSILESPRDVMTPEEVRAMAEGIYGELHAIPGGLDLLVTGLQEELLRQGMSALSK